LNKLSRPTNPAAPAGETRPLNISWIIGEACPRTPMPAVTFMHSTPHSSQNCGVRHAVSTSTCADVTSFFGCVGAVQPAGFQSAGGMRTTRAPIMMNRR
jgi:hypothetical protein